MIRSSRRFGKRSGRADISRYVAIALVISGCTCNDLAGPDAQLREAAKGLEATREIPEARLHVDKLQITRITPEPELSPPRVVFSFDLEGRADLASVSAIGVERVPMVHTEGGWYPPGPVLPRLSQVLQQLEQRPSARAAGTMWVIRVDLDKVLVTEDRGREREMLELRPLADGGLAIVP